jgi:hypothetical protein
MDLFDSQVLYIKHAPFSLDEMAATQGNFPWGQPRKEGNAREFFPRPFSTWESCSLPAVTDPTPKAIMESHYRVTLVS